MDQRRVMHPYRRLKAALSPVLVRAGLSEVSEEVRPDVFGSVHVTYSDGHFTLRLMWDGKDGIGFVQRGTPDGWADVPAYVTEGDLEGAAVDEAKVTELRRAVERTISRGSV